MIRKLVVVAAAVAAVAVGQVVPANAAEKKPYDPTFDAVSIGVGAAATAGYFALGHWRLKYENVNHISAAGAWAITTMGCAAISPMVATVVLKRPLTMREGDSLIASCLIPFIGGWLVDQAFDAHPEWDPDYKPVAMKKKKHAKM
jgi:hypothetical protein